MRMKTFEMLARQVGDLNDYDGSKFEGTWELIYSTSVKRLWQHLDHRVGPQLVRSSRYWQQRFRRWGSVLNAERNIKNAEFEASIRMPF